MEYIDVLVNPQDPEPNLDVVFVHGLNPKGDPEHARKTWTHENGTFWPETLLPELLPTARIILFAYNSSVLSNASNVSVANHAQSLLNDVNNKRLEAQEIHRPLIFIAHSLGGLLVKQALLEASLNLRKYGCLKASTYGLVFFATPHAGGNRAGVANVASKVCSVLTGEPSNSLLATLEKDSLLNEISSDQFAHQVNDYEILTFYETRKMSVRVGKRKLFPQVTSMYIVEKSAAKLGPDPLPLDRNHSDICKFSGTEDRVWERVGPNLKIMGAKARENKVNCDHALPQPSSAPLHAVLAPDTNDFRVEFSLTGLPVSGNFVDRDAEMEEMDHCLRPSKPQDGRRIHVLHGLGGIGKTQLTIAYARKHQDRYSSIIWLHGNSRDTLLQSFASFATYANINGIPASATKAPGHAHETLEKAKVVLGWLARKGNRGWLVVFDNVDRDYPTKVKDSQAYDIEEFLPAADHGSILITTRLPNLGHLGTQTKVTTVNKEQALQILTNNSRLPPSSPDMESLVTRLGKLPLAIVQAGRYMCKTGTTCQSYLRLYETSWSDLQAKAPRLHDYPNRSIQMTWSISCDHIRQSDPTAVKLLQLWAYLDHQDLWFELLERGSRGSEDPKWFQDIVQSEISFKSVIERLLDYSLVESHQDTESYSMHPVVHDWCSESIGRGNVDLMALALIVIGFATPKKSEPEYCVMQQRLLPHANRCVQQLSSMNILDTIDYQDSDEAFHMLGYLYSHQGKMAEAEKMYQRALDGKEKAWGPEHISTLDTVNNLGALYSDQGKMAEAEKMYQRALDGKEKALGPEHISTLDTVNNLGALYSDQGKMAEAEKMYQRALDGKEKVWGPEHISTFDTVNNLGVLYKKQGRMAEAEKMYQRVLDRYEADGLEHISIFQAIKNLGVLYEKQGRIAEAEKMYQRALDGYEACGLKHRSIFDAINNLGGLYEDQGKIAEAEKMYQRALDGYEACGLKHRSIFDAINNLGGLYEDQGKIAEAEKMYQRALDGYEKALGPEHISTLDTINNLGNLYADQGKMPEAEKMYQRALDGYEKAWGPEHISTLRTVSNLGVLYEDQGRMAEAEKMYQRALDGYEAYGPEHRSIFDAINNLGLLYEDQGKMAEAEKMYQRALDGYKAYGLEYISIFDAINNLGLLYEDQGKMAEAEKMYQRALDGYQKLGGQDHPSTERTRRNLNRVREQGITRHLPNERE